MEKYVRDSVTIKPPESFDKFTHPMGVFVTLYNASPNGRELRGCIGHPFPEKPLIDALIDVAISSAANDPRFSRVTSEELKDIIVEVSILSPPELIKVSSPQEYRNYIKVGEDGLLVKWRLGSGLLLPQVPVEYGWDIQDFLSNTCMKAGASPDLWLTSEVEIYKFQALIFYETTPKGFVVRRRLK